MAFVREPARKLIRLAVSGSSEENVNVPLNPEVELLASRMPRSRAPNLMVWLPWMMDV